MLFFFYRIPQKILIFSSFIFLPIISNFHALLFLCEVLWSIHSLSFISFIIFDVTLLLIPQLIHLAKSVITSFILLKLLFFKVISAKLYIEHANPDSSSIKISSSVIINSLFAQSTSYAIFLSTKYLIKNYFLIETMPAVSIHTSSRSNCFFIY